MGKRYHVKNDVWLVQTGLPNYVVEKAGRPFALFVFCRQITKAGSRVESHLTFIDTGVSIVIRASKFGSALNSLRKVDWEAPAPQSVEEFAA